MWQVRLTGHFHRTTMRHAMQLAAFRCPWAITAASAVNHSKIWISAAHFHTKGSSNGSSNGSLLLKPLLLVSDLDDTLVQHTFEGAQGAETAAAAFKDLWERSKAAGINCKLAVNTGRTFPLFEAAWQAKQWLLPQPDVLIAAVGTRCYHYDRQTGGWNEDLKWTEQMNEGWDAAKAKAVVDELIATFGPQNVEYRSRVELHEHKLTVLYRKALHDQVMPHLHNSLQQAGVQATVLEGGEGTTNCTTIRWSQTTCGRGPEWQFIDVLPQNAGKGKAMRYIQQQLGFGDTSTVAAGDANNDMPMLQQAPRSILVGNASPELKQWARQQHSMYIATEPVAAGVLEGLQALGMLELRLPHLVV